VPSVVIPAHNEEAVIERTRRGVLADDIPDLEIVVVVNASSDRTAEIAAGVDPRVTVMDVPTPGKSNALNVGGCYAVSAAGRSRWEAFPDVISDDGFVENHFGPGESRTVVGRRAVVRPPRDLSSLITVRIRIRRGMIQLARRFPRLVGKHPSQVGGVLRRMLWRPWTWASLLLYCFVRACEPLLARRQIARGEKGWGRDESSRTAN